MTVVVIRKYDRLKIDMSLAANAFKQFNYFSANDISTASLFCNVAPAISLLRLF